MPQIYNELKNYASAKRQKSNEWFFKTGVGQYGEGDKFMGKIKTSRDLFLLVNI